MLSTIRVLFSALIISTVFLGSAAVAGNPEGKIVTLEPVWEKVDGQWKFNQSNTTDRQILVHITSSTINTRSKKLLIKDLVKLPFVIIVDKNDLETRPN